MESHKSVAGLVSTFQVTDLSGQVLIVLLVALSIAAWSFIISKWIDLVHASGMTRDFFQAYRREPHPVALFLKRQKFSPSPVYAVYEETCKALGMALEGGKVEDGKAEGEDLFRGAVGATNRHITVVQSGELRNIAMRAESAQKRDIARNVGYVALATMLAPLLGLLGSLWMIMNILGSIRGPAEELFATVAPYLSSALLPMVVGLLVAIPSGIGYHFMMQRIERFSVEMQDFSQELLSSMERNYLQN